MSGFEEIPGTWAHILDQHWIHFNEWVRILDDSNGKVPHEKWREYILWDMQRKHDEETKGGK